MKICHNCSQQTDDRKGGSNLSQLLLGVVKNKWFIAAIISMTVLVIGGWTGYNVYLNQNPKINYLLVEYKSLKKNKDTPLDLYEDELQFLKALRSESLSFAADVRSKFNANAGADNEWMEMFHALDLLGQVTLSLQGGRDLDEEWSEIQVRLLEGRRSFVDMTLQSDQDRIYLDSDTLMDHPVYWTKEDLMETITGQDVRSLQKREEEFNEWLQSFQWNEEEKALLQEWMRNFILDELTNSAFEVEKKVNYASPDGTVPLKKITLTLDGYMLKNILVRMVDDVRTNDELLNLIVKRAEMIDALSKWEALQQADPLYVFYEDVDQEEAFNREEFTELLHVFLYRLRTYLLNEFSGALYMETYVNKENVIVDRHIELSVSGEDTTWEIDWNRSYWKDREAVVHTNRELNFNVRETDFSGSINFYQDQTFQKDNEMGKLDGEIGFSVREDRTHVINISADYSFQEALGAKGTSEYDLLLSIMSEGERVRLDIQAEREKNRRNNLYEQTIDVQTNLTAPVVLGRPITFSIDTTMNIELEKGTPPKKSNLERRAVNWMSMSEEEQNEFGNELMERLATQFGSVFLDFLF